MNFIKITQIISGLETSSERELNINAESLSEIIPTEEGSLLKLSNGNEYFIKEKPSYVIDCAINTQVLVDKKATGQRGSIGITVVKPRSSNNHY